MAIKRSSKSRGAPLRKPVSSASVRHIDVMPKHQMVAGTVYEGWLCKNPACALVIALGPRPQGGNPATRDSEDHLSVLKCPHCGNEDLYRWSARGEHTFAQRTASS
jgi:hypothetical protein